MILVGRSLYYSRVLWLGEVDTEVMIPYGILYSWQSHLLADTFIPPAKSAGPGRACEPSIASSCHELVVFRGC